MQIETFWGVGKNWAASRYKSKRTMRQAVEHIRAAWYGAPAGSEGAGPNAKAAVNCAGLINKAIVEAQRMVDGFKGQGVWGDLLCRAPDGEDGAPRMQFGYSGRLATDDSGGKLDEGVAARLSKVECQHITAAAPDTAAAFDVAAEGAEKQADIRQHRLPSIAPGEQKLRWADTGAIAVADLVKAPPDAGLIDSADHLSAVDMLSAILDAPNGASSTDTDIDDEAPVAE